MTTILAFLAGFAAGLVTVSWYTREPVAEVYEPSYAGGGY